jgi:hypothetical protein
MELTKIGENLYNQNTYPQWEIKPFEIVFHGKKISYLPVYNCNLSPSQGQEFHNLMMKCDFCDSANRKIAKYAPQKLLEETRKLNSIRQGYKDGIELLCSNPKISGAFVLFDDIDSINPTGLFAHVELHVKSTTTLPKSYFSSSDRTEFAKLLDKLGDQKVRDTITNGLEKITLANLLKYKKVFDFACEIADYHLDQKLKVDIAPFMFSVCYPKIQTFDKFGSSLEKWPGKLLLKTLIDTQEKSDDFIKLFTKILDPGTHMVATKGSNYEFIDSVFNQMMGETTFTRGNFEYLTRGNEDKVPDNKINSIKDLVSFYESSSADIYVTGSFSPFNLYKIEGDGEKIWGNYTYEYFNKNTVRLESEKLVDIIRYIDHHSNTNYVFVFDRRSVLGNNPPLWESNLPSKVREMFKRSLAQYKNTKSVNRIDNRLFIRAEIHTEDNRLLQSLNVKIKNINHNVIFGDKMSLNDNVERGDQTMKLYDQFKQLFIEDTRKEKEELRKKIDDLDKEKECPVCLDVFDTMELFTGSCGHLLCEVCIEQLTNCPMCRLKLQTPEKVYKRLKENKPLF